MTSFAGGTLDSGTQAVQVEQDVVVARQTVRKLATQCGMRLVDQTKLITAASELARNTVIYGGGGHMDWSVVEKGVRKGLRLLFRDEGPGIPDLKLAMSDGWTSGNGLGLGLSGAKRLVDEFDIDTAAGRGTRITLVKWA
ncbi:anti-sigma B factor RsbT [Lysobacter dokdonensis DS-58]|uniref:Anti-sigma B factor RsbT n=1 Tax=Lysobacter dokdonensis DS-58 TaxID=1300345 RepID=A0A0A2WP11_9GAMM|nr:anti-sigma regulatory factor [Lysobacter dokdonensis]KGQ20020.1 anti-sigma B factor RsbT [Lysobacter dokdonensis DS-58]